LFLTIVRKELLAGIHSMRYLVTFVLFIVLTVSVTVMRTHLYKKQVIDHTKAQQEWMRTMESVERFWQSRGLGITVEKAPNPLSVISAGLENELTRSFSLSDWAPPTTGPRKLGSPSYQYNLRLDMVMIIALVCSLMALLLTYDSICGEREQGTLKMMLSGPLPRDSIITGKLFAGLLMILIPLAIAWLFNIFYVLFIAKLQFTPDDYRRLSWILALSVAYIVFFFSLGTAVSTWVQRSATAMAICLFCWVMFVLTIPNLVPMAVNRIVPIPPQSKILMEKQAIWRYIEKDLIPKIREELSKTGEYASWEEMEPELWRRVRVEFERHAAKIDRYYNTKIKSQLLVNQQVSRISPAASFIYASTHLAGTGVQDYLRLLTDVERFQADFLIVKEQQEEHRLQERKKLPPDQQRDGPGVHRIDRYDPKLWPAFKPERIRLGIVLNQCWLDIVLLSGGFVLLLLLSVIGFMRYDPR
jgi:ABC-type transport system involved in multi-copper enzyme maturation permease subunit